ncbi:MAG TPA: hypothetical protein VEL07_00105 [Planctomycetota bacterium]|nr:hypothetical protein [Planctomycetota bacterium]
MNDVPDLVSDGKIDPAAVERLDLDWPRALADASASPAQLAAIALAAGARKAANARDALLAMLARDDVAGRTAAWALAQIDSEAQVVQAIQGGNIDVRDNGYWSLAIRAAGGRASPGLAAAMTARVAAEVERAKGGATGLGDRACRVLAVLGAKDTDAAVQSVLDGDRFADRFELQRLRKAVQDGRRDQESIAELNAPWRTLFADHLVVPKPATPAPPVAPVAPGAKGAPTPAAGKAPPAKAPPANAPPAVEDDVSDDDAALAEGDDVADAEAEAAAAGASKPVDWKSFAASPEATALTPQVRQLIAQLGPLLEQLAARAINAPLADLSGQEFAALLLQVLPQALPQQHVQMALSPQALNGYQALTKFLARTGGATYGEDLVAAVKMVRAQLQAQIRQAGILGGPDYSDPDEAPTPVAT